MWYLIAQTAVFILLAAGIGLWLGWFLGKLSRQLEIDVLQRRVDNAQHDLTAAKALTALAEQQAEEQREALRECREHGAALQRELDELRGAADAAPGQETEREREPPPAVSAALARAAAALHGGPPGGGSSAPTPPADSSAATADDLQRIKGIGPRLATLLNELGIHRLRQIADLTPEQIVSVNERLRFKGRIERERWVEQARALLGD
jgi:NADH-quinone oxidoreductase subunit E